MYPKMGKLAHPAHDRICAELSQAMSVVKPSFFPQSKMYIMITCPCNVDPLTPQFYKFLGLQGYAFLSYLALSIDFGYSFEPTH